MNEYYDEFNPAHDMYYEDGSFKPLTASYGNISGDVETYRNTYMEAEREYFIKLLEDPEIREEFESYENYTSDELFYYAMDIQRKLEYGELETPEEIKLMASMPLEEADKYHMRKLEQAEGMMCLLFAAARDKALIYTLVRRPSHGRGR